jgi:hypothetical protein
VSDLHAASLVRFVLVVVAFLAVFVLVTLLHSIIFFELPRFFGQ